MTTETETYEGLKITQHKGASPSKDKVYIEMDAAVPLSVLRDRLFGPFASDLRKVDLIPISEAAARMGMTRGAFMTLRKSLGIKAVGYKINWPTVVKRLEESQNPTNERK